MFSRPQFVWKMSLILSFLLSSSVHILPVVNSQETAVQNSKQTTQIPELILEVGKPVDREIKNGEVHRYSLVLAAGQYAVAVVEPKNAEVVVTVIDGDSRPVVDIGSAFGLTSVMTIRLLAEEAGGYTVQVKLPEKDPVAGNYVVKLIELRPSTVQDKPIATSQLAGQKAFTEGETLRGQGTKAALQQAMVKYTEALPNFRTSGDKFAEAETLSDLGLVYDKLSDARKAIECYEQTLAIRREVGDKKGEADTLTDIGAAYRDLGEPEKALKVYEQALQIEHLAENKRSEAITLNNMGIVYADLSDHPKALEYYRRALSIYRLIGDKREEGVTLNNIGQVYVSSAEYQKALEYHQQAMTLRRETGDKRGEAYSLNNIGQVYSKLGEKPKALDYYNQSLALRREVGDRRGEANMLTNLGSLYWAMNEEKRALELMEQAVPILREIGDKRLEARTLTNLGIAYKQSGEKQKALEFLQQALVLIRVVGSREWESGTLTSIGSSYCDQGEYQKAEEFFVQSLQLSQASGSKQNEAETFHEYAKLERKRGNLLKACSRIEQAIKTVEFIRANAGSQEHRSSYFSTVREYFEFYLSLLMQLHRQEPTAGHDATALTLSEQARARSLLELLSEARIDIRQGVDPQLLERERNLRQQIAAKGAKLTKLLAGRVSEEQQAAAKKEIDGLTAEYQAVQNKIKETSPRYAALTQPQPLTAREIREQVADADTLLLEFSLGADHSYLWAVAPDGITFCELPKRAEIEAAARRVTQLLTTRSKSLKVNKIEDGNRAAADEADAQYWKAAGELSDLILGPVAGQLGTKRLLIVADGALQYVPFAALPLPAVRSPQPAARSPLIVDHEIVILPSASTLAVLRRQTAGRKPAEKKLVILADPVFDKNDVRVAKGKEPEVSTGSPQSSQPSTGDSQLSVSEASRNLTKVQAQESAKAAGVADENFFISRLPGTRKEAQAILKFVPPADCRQVLDFDANRAAVVNSDLNRFQIVHFATHGFVNSERPELSGLVLSLVDKTGQPQNGFLLTPDVFNLNLSADLVVLSACETGLGKDIKGEGLVGLTRGFMYAGTPRLVVSLWSVSDQATSELMEKFYQKMLVEKQRPAAALRAAQLELLKDGRWKSPYYWAPFILQGEFR